MKWALASSLLVANSQQASGAVVAPPRRVKRQQQRNEQTTAGDTTARKPRRAREKIFFQNQPPQQQQAGSREQENPAGAADSRLLSSSSLKESVSALRQQVSAERLRNTTSTTTKASSSSSSSSSHLLGLQECVPKENHDPDVGILSKSCRDEQICQVSELSGLGGFCRPTTTASKVEDAVIDFASKNARKVADDILRAAKEGKENWRKDLPASKNLSSLHKKSIVPPHQSKIRTSGGEGAAIVFCDPDLGILDDRFSCPDHDQVCLTDSTSPLGGVCQQTQSSSSKKRRLEEPGYALDFGFDPYACDYSQFDREVNSGTVMCDYGTLCNDDSSICASITLSETIFNGESLEYTVCYVLDGNENYGYYVDHNYCITQQFVEQTCSIEVYDTECNACSLNDNDDDAYGSGCFDFDW